MGFIVIIYEIIFLKYRIRIFIDPVKNSIKNLIRKKKIPKDDKLAQYIICNKNTYK